MKSEELTYKKLLEQVRSSERPVVLVNACTHGTETVGIGVIEQLKKLKVNKGTLLFNIANERARKSQVAFTETDLNRSFPGNAEGSYEERLAHLIHPVVQACDVVLDIHSTETNDPGNESAVIVTKFDDATKKVLDSLSPRLVYIMDYTRSNALVSDATVGIGFEYGRNNHPLTLSMTVRDIQRLLFGMGMIALADETCKKNDTIYYRVFDVIPKVEGVKLKELINLKEVKKGQIIGEKNGTPYLAPYDFVPILFGSNRYKDIFGFVGTRVHPD